MTVLPTAYQQVIHKTRYARWMETENRRENWDETVDRYMDYNTLKLKIPSQFKVIFVSIKFDIFLIFDLYSTN